MATEYAALGGHGVQRVSHMVGGERRLQQPAAANRQTQARIVRAAVLGATLLLAVCASALLAGGGTAVLSTTQLDNMAAGVASPLFAQASAEQDTDPANLTASGGELPDEQKALVSQATGEQTSDPASKNSSGINEIPPAIQAWLDDMKTKVAIDPTDTVKVDSLPVQPIPTEIVAQAKQAEDEMNMDDRTP
jgi:hypothetical protein